MTSKAKEILIKARELIAKPENWTKGELARDFNGRDVAPDDDRACRWCLVGAISKVTGSFGSFTQAYFDAINRFGNVSGNSFGAFNDFSTHEQVLAKFDEAIASES